MLGLNNVHLQLQNQIILQRTNVDFPLHKISILLGPSGCGKSTVLRLLAGLIKPNQGQVLRPEAKMSLVFQEPRLLPWLTVAENLLLPFHLGKLEKTQRPDPQLVLEMVGVAKIGNLYPHQLSGGMKMRVAIARALISEPQILLMDEPFAALDEVNRQGLQDLILQLQARLNMSVVFVTHSLAEACLLGDQLYLMKSSGGTIQQQPHPKWNNRTTRQQLRQDPEYFAQIAKLSSIYSAWENQHD